MADRSKTITLRLAGIPQPPSARSLPTLLRATERSGSSHDPFLDEVVEVESSYSVDATARDSQAAPRDEPIAASSLLLLEATDGTLVFQNAERLLELQRERFPDQTAGDVLDLALVRDRSVTERGVGDWIWRTVSVLRLKQDAIVDAAIDKAQEWVRERLEDFVEDAAQLGASWWGAKALMWAIESRLAGRPGPYLWRGEPMGDGDHQTPEQLRALAEGGPLLVLLHGTGSHTHASFKGLLADGAAWGDLRTHFGNRIVGFEHRSFSESPIDNALALAQQLPARARLALLSHSRGGLVGDLLCAQEFSDAAIKSYRQEPPQKESKRQQALRERVAVEEQDKLRSLRLLLREKELRIERYVRVAAPAGGTTLLSDNLDLFLSGLLSLTGKLVGAVAGPGASPFFSAFKRIVMEIADKRLEPRLVPGIEAMLPEAPMARLLAGGRPRPEVRMAVVAGDCEMDSWSFKRLGLAFTDWMFFDNAKNDLVVDTQSMYAGVAQVDTRALYDEGAEVNHFNYFSNKRSQDAVRSWLTGAQERLDAIPNFEPLEPLDEPDTPSRGGPAETAAATNSLPVVVLLPGTMGSYLRAYYRRRRRNGDRIWFDVDDLMRGGMRHLSVDAERVEPDGLFDRFLRQPGRVPTPSRPPRRAIRLRLATHRRAGSRSVGASGRPGAGRSSRSTGAPDGP